MRHRRLAVVRAAMADKQVACSAKDWAGDWIPLAFLWGIPAAAILVAAFLEPSVRAVVWTVMLIWMGGACLANAHRCARTHCRYTGRFFLVMAAFVVVHATDTLSLGTHGWAIIGVMTVVGNALIWWASERLLGTFRPGD